MNKLQQHKFEIIYITLSIMVIAYILNQMILTYFYPTLNDIVGILTISSLEGTAKWLNGFYGPGYTIISKFIGFDMSHWGVLYLSTIFLSLMCSLYFIRQINKLERDSSKKYILALGNILFHIFLFLQIGFNYSDGIFIFLLFSGMSLFFSASYINRYTMAQIIGLLIMGSTILFRTHGLIFSIMVVVLFLLFAKTSAKHLFYTLGILLLPTFLYFGLFYINDIPYQNWQKFNMVKFLYGIDFYRVDMLLEDEKYKNFNLFSAIFNNTANVIHQSISVLKISIPQTFLFFIAPLFAYVITRKNFFLAALVIAIIYFIIILPGWLRGVYPLYILTYMVFVYLYLLKNNFKFLWISILIVLSINLWKPIQYTYYQALGQRHYAEYIQNNLESSMKKVGIKDINTVFTDDYDLYLYSFDILKIHNFNGWSALHPARTNEKPNKMFKESSFDQHGINYIIAKKGGYIERAYAPIKYKDVVSLNYHNIYILK